MNKHLFSKGVNDACIEVLDLMASGDITQRNWNDIKRIYQNYSRALVKKRLGFRPIVSKSNGFGASRGEISNLLSEFKQDIINNVATKLDTMHDKRKQEEFEAMLTKYCSYCR